jgi:hypothetical protein
VAEQISPLEGFSSMKIGTLPEKFRKCFHVSVPVGHFPAVYGEHHQYTENITE